MTQQDSRIWRTTVGSIRNRHNRNTMLKFSLGLVFMIGRVGKPQRVLLIKKNRPAWCAGLYAAIGGKEEKTDESSAHAMAREFHEEAGVSTTSADWTKFLVLRDGASRYQMTFFKMFDNSIFWMAEMQEDELLVKVTLDEALKLPLIASLPWIIPLALDRYAIPAMMIEHGREWDDPRALRSA